MSECLDRLHQQRSCCHLCPSLWRDRLYFEVAHTPGSASSNSHVASNGFWMMSLCTDAERLRAGERSPSIKRVALSRLQELANILDCFSSGFRNRALLTTEYTNTNILQMCWCKKWHVNDKLMTTFMGQTGLRVSRIRCVCVHAHSRYYCWVRGQSFRSYLHLETTKRLPKSTLTDQVVKASSNIPSFHLDSSPCHFLNSSDPVLGVHDGLNSPSASRCRSEAAEPSGFVPISFTLWAPSHFPTATSPEHVWCGDPKTVTSKCRMRPTPARKGTDPPADQSIHKRALIDSPIELLHAKHIFHSNHCSARTWASAEDCARIYLPRQITDSTHPPTCQTTQDDLFRVERSPAQAPSV